MRRDKSSLNKSEKIRALHSQGMPTAEIAKRLGIRYQFAYGVINKSGAVNPKRKPILVPLQKKPPLTVDRLIQGGFSKVSHWRISSNKSLVLEAPMPAKAGVYAFAKAGVVQYVGVATTTLAKRCAFYIKPGPTQTTSQRLNAMLLDEIKGNSTIEIYSISVSDCGWNGWKIDGNLGLEGGLISNFHLPWNKRGASPFMAKQ